ncbi:MAG: hypothetical protein K1X78_07795 [Verrucomicrobiaceae bacterium]|nr:hypothetical protein [Verrucomicrobiaceae bacterium]
MRLSHLILPLALAACQSQHQTTESIIADVARNTHESSLADKSIRSYWRSKVAGLEQRRVKGRMELPSIIGGQLHADTISFEDASHRRGVARGSVYFEGKEEPQHTELRGYAEEAVFDLDRGFVELRSNAAVERLHMATITTKPASTIRLTKTSISIHGPSATFSRP